jgi:hypothetical protein
MATATLVHTPAAPAPKLDPTDFTRETWRAAYGMARRMVRDRRTTTAVYRPRLVGHRTGAYAARAAGESCSSLRAAGGRKPCRSMSQAVL